MRIRPLGEACPIAPLNTPIFLPDHCEKLPQEYSHRTVLDCQSQLGKRSPQTTVILVRYTAQRQPLIGLVISRYSTRRLCRFASRRCYTKVTKTKIATDNAENMYTWAARNNSSADLTFCKWKGLSTETDEFTQQNSALRMAYIIVYTVPVTILGYVYCVMNRPRYC